MILLPGLPRIFMLHHHRPPPATSRTHPIRPISAASGIQHRPHPHRPSTHTDTAQLGRTPAAAAPPCRPPNASHLALPSSAAPASSPCPRPSPAALLLPHQPRRRPAPHRPGHHHPASSHARGNWGLKRDLPTKTRYPFLRYTALDTLEHFTTYESASDDVLTLKKWQEMDVPSSAGPQSTPPPWQAC